MLFQNNDSFGKDAIYSVELRSKDLELVVIY